MTDSIAALYRTLAPSRRHELAGTMVLMLLGAAAEMMTIGAVLPFLALVANPASTLIGPTARDLLDFAGLGPIVGSAILLVAAGALAAALRLAIVWSTQKTVNGIAHDLSTSIFHRLLHQPYPVHIGRNSSEILAGVEKVHTLTYTVLHPIMQGIIAVVLTLAIGGLLFVIDAVAAAVAALSLAAAYGALALFTRRWLQGNSKLLSGSLTRRTKLLQESLGSIRDILLDGSQSLFEKRFNEIDSDMHRGRVVSTFIAQAPRLVVEAVAILGIAIVTISMTLRPGGITAAIPVLGSLALGAQRLLPLVQQIWVGFAHARGNLQMLDDVLELANTPLPPKPPPVSPGETLTGDIFFDRVSFSYSGSAWSLRDITVHIKEGEPVGIVGPSGCGKSTLLDLLMGLLQPSAGAIRVGGVELDERRLPRWQASLSHVPQSLYLTDDTLLANIAIGLDPADVDEARVVEAARAAQAHDFIEALPNGYRTLIGERGVRLSGGQRQRIGIARALYRQRPVLILDEATSALDSTAEAAVLGSLIEQRLTLIMIAHREDSLRLCDAIIRFEGGSAVRTERPAMAADRAAIR